MPPEASYNLDTGAINRLPVLPEVLLYYSKYFNTYGFEDTLLWSSEDAQRGELIMDPALALKVLAMRREFNQHDVTDHQACLDNLDEVSFSLLWSSVVTGSARISGDEELSAYLKQHWLQSVRAAFMMESLAKKCAYAKTGQARFCGLLMYAGKLLLLPGNMGGNRYSFPKLLTSATALENELKQHGTTHNRLLARLLENLGVPALVCDALRYQHEGARLLRSAPLLSRLQWVTEELVGNREPENTAVTDAAALLGLEINELMALREEAEAEALGLAAEWGISTAEPTAEKMSNADSIKSQVMDRFHAMALSALLEDSAGVVADEKAVDVTQSFIEQGLVLTLGSRGYLLLGYNRETEQLEYISSNLDAELVEGLCIPCDPDNRDGFIATDCFQHSEPVSRMEYALSTVLDKQLLKSLGADCLNAYPLITGPKQVGVLLAGSLTTRNSSEMSEQVFLRSFLSAIAERQLDAGSHREPARAADDRSDPAGTGFIDHRAFRNMVHEVNNPLTIIKNYLQLLGVKLKENSDIQEDLKIIDSEIGRVSAILHNYRDGTSSTTQEQVSLNQQVESITRVMAAALDESDGITIATDLEPELAGLDCEQDKLRQIITNLVKNAVEALQGGGEITVSTSSEIDMSGTQFQKLTVSDNGPGLDPVVRANLFQHGYSTKGDGHSGAGLAITRGLVEEMSGTINCQSSRKGTSFSLLLPVEQKP